MGFDSDLRTMLHLSGESGESASGGRDSSLEEVLNQYTGLTTIHECYRLMRKISREIEKFRNRIATEHNISGAELYILWNILMLHQCTYSELADHSGVARNTLSILAKSLVKREYVKQLSDPSDGRVTRLITTSTGRKVIHDVVHAMGSSVEASIIWVLTDAVLDKTAQNALENLGNVLKVIKG